ncbi:hypothetical protein C8R44DRAFT_877433 [Mycena epipterygia]|nr:hypothetical protein C8R44DRAFT_877433 [Mycena epipterygia]
MNDFPPKKSAQQQPAPKPKKNPSKPFAVPSRTYGTRPKAAHVIIEIRILPTRARYAYHHSWACYVPFFILYTLFTRPPHPLLAPLGPRTIFRPRADPFFIRLSTPHRSQKQLARNAPQARVSCTPCGSSPPGTSAYPSFPSLPPPPSSHRHSPSLPRLPTSLPALDPLPAARRPLPAIPSLTSQAPRVPLHPPSLRPLLAASPRPTPFSSSLSLSRVFAPCPPPTIYPFSLFPPYPSSLPSYPRCHHLPLRSLHVFSLLLAAVPPPAPPPHFLPPAPYSLLAVLPSHPFFLLTTIYSAWHPPQELKHLSAAEITAFRGRQGTQAGQADGGALDPIAREEEHAVNPPATKKCRSKSKACTVSFGCAGLSLPPPPILLHIPGLFHISLYAEAPAKADAEEDDKAGKKRKRAGSPAPAKTKPKPKARRTGRRREG